MLNLTVSKTILDLAKRPEGFLESLHEVITLLGWHPNDIDGSIHIDENLTYPEGSARVSHHGTHHEILMHPRTDKPFPWPTIRHELMHVALKSRISNSLDEQAFALPIEQGYCDQTFRENLEEYFVRALNIIPMREQFGENWYREQIQCEVNNGFLLMPRASVFASRFHDRKGNFDVTTFIEFAEALQSKT